MSLGSKIVLQEYALKRLRWALRSLREDGRNNYDQSHQRGILLGAIILDLPIGLWRQLPGPE